LCAITVSRDRLTLPQAIGSDKNKRRTFVLARHAAALLLNVDTRGSLGVAMAVAAVSGGEVARLDMGRVITSTVRTLFRRGVPLLLLGLPFVVLPNVLAAFAPPSLSAINFLTGLPALVFVGGATLIAYRDICGEAPVGVAQAISEGGGRFGSLWVVGLISGVATLVGLLLLIVPGLLITAIWSTASAAVVIEHMTASQALQRAWALSKGSRLRMLGLLAIALLAIGLVVFVMVGLIFAATIALGEPIGTKISDFLLAPLTTLGLFQIMTVGSTATYVALRQAREGAGGGIATVFD
jgi:hypothetical protein